MSSLVVVDNSDIEFSLNVSPMKIYYAIKRFFAVS